MRALAFVIATSSLLLAGCGIDQGRCLQAHDEKYEATVMVAYIPTGNGMGFPIYGTIPAVRSVCDQWEFPEGRK
jgi:hypothetical protein